MAKATIKSGILSGLIMIAIYMAITWMGAQSRGVLELSENGSIALAEISGHYFGTAGTLLLAGISTFACLKTAIGLTISCGETFEKMFPRGPKYKVWVFIFAAASFGFANVGLTAIIAYAVPVLMFLYPLAITLIVLALCGRLFQHDRAVYVCVTVFTLMISVFDFAAALPETAIQALHLGAVLEWAKQYIPLFKMGLGWLLPAFVGLVIGLIIHFCRKKS